jgi:hypothetical protein
MSTTATVSVKAEKKMMAVGFRNWQTTRSTKYSNVSVLLLQSTNGIKQTFLTTAVD